MVARQLVRAVRGSRSQEAFSRRLGYRSNPVADWEAGRRFPVAAEFLRACQLARIDVAGAFERFRPEEATALGEIDDDGVAAWLEALRGSTAINDLAERMEVSRYAISRWLKGTTRPRLPDFLKLVEVLTDRLSDLVAELVRIEEVPALAEVHRERHASRTLAFEEPWTEAILRVLETRAYRGLPAHLPGWIADRLGIGIDTERRCLERLAAAAVVARDEAGRWQPVGALTVDTRADPEGTLRLKHHWAGMGVQRATAPREGDMVSYNVVGVSRDDLERIREAHVRYFHEVRQIVANSEPVEVAALVNIQLMTWVQ
jgi:transcriptional regulator with XRE-family HTH domain